MRYLIASDIHANLEALEAALAVAEGRYERVICLGDIVGYGADPNAAVEWVRKHAVAVVRGNHDKAGCGITDAQEFNAAARTAALWTRRELTPENLNYLRELPSGPLEVEDFEIVHGSLGDEDEYLLVAGDAAPEFEKLPTQVTFFGHTHLQGGFVSVGQRVQALKPTFEAGVSSWALEVGERLKCLLNPGSIGQPRDGDSRAAFAIYNSLDRVLEYWRVPYDIETTQRKMIAAGLPEILAYRLNYGR